MKFKTHNDEEINFNGTYLLGSVDTTYTNLVAMFGEPTDGDGYKCDAHWAIQFEDGTVITIYNYKDGINYNGADGIPTEEITDWHIGGHDTASLSLIDTVKQITS